MFNIQPYGQFQFDRAQQINELLVSVPSCRAVNPDRSLLEVPVRLANGALVALRISVPPAFPQEKPVLSVTSPVRHPWVDSIGRLSFPQLDRWAGSSTRMAAVVSEAMQGLSSATAAGPTPGPAGPQPGGPARPPQPHYPPSGGPASPPGPASAAGPSSSSSSPQKPRLPPPRTEFPELGQLTNSDLAHVLTEAEAYSLLLQRVGISGGSTEGTSEVVRQLRAAVQEQAQRNLGREGEMAEIRNQIAIIRSSEYAPALASYEEKAEKQKAVLDLLSPKALVQRLQAAAQEADEESDRLYKQFAEGSLGLEAFVQQYTAARAVFHQRDLKAQAAVCTIPMDV